MARLLGKSKGEEKQRGLVHSCLPTPAELPARYEAVGTDVGRDLRGSPQAASRASRQPHIIMPTCEIANQSETSVSVTAAKLVHQRTLRPRSAAEPLAVDSS